MSSSIADVLFQPLQIKSLHLKNRIVMAPMTRTFSPEGVPGENVAAYYRRRAEGEVGLILTEGTVINRPASRNHPAIPKFYGAEALAGWQRVVNEVHAGNGLIGPQIWHTGSLQSPSTNWVPDEPVESPSGLEAPGKLRGKAMTDSDIADTIAAFAQAAADAKRLGFDVAEIHGAHGYLIDEFFWAGTNERTDIFGGATIQERSRFAVEVVKAVRAAVGPDFPVIIRLSQWKQQDFAARLATTPDEMAFWLVPLVEAGADVLHCSQRRFWVPEFPEIDGENGLNFAGWAKKLTGAFTISVGSVGLSGDLVSAFSGQDSQPTSLDVLAQRLERNEFDLVAVGRALITDPAWPRKVRESQLSELVGFHVSSLGELV